MSYEWGQTDIVVDSVGLHLALFVCRVLHTDLMSCTDGEMQLSARLTQCSEICLAGLSLSNN